MLSRIGGELISAKYSRPGLIMAAILSFHFIFMAGCSGGSGNNPNQDFDADGYNRSVDCDDNNSQVHPGAVEICGDGLDNDCAGGDDDCATCPQGAVSERCVCGGDVVDSDYCCDGNVQTTSCDTPPEGCGDGVIEGNETCDDGVANNGVACVPGYGDTCTYCSISCQPVTINGGYCGDGICNPEESAADCADCLIPGCTDGETQTMGCLVDGFYGARTRTCSASGEWGEWGICQRDSLEPPILGDVYYVSTSGANIADDTNHGTDTAPWRTLQYAVNQLGPGDTLMVRRGFYDQSVTIGNGGTNSHPITIRSEVPHTAKINGGLTINADYVTIYGLDIEQPSAGTGVVINGVQGTQILNNRIHDCPMYGIRVASNSAADFQIRNNILSYNGQVGIRFDGGADGLMENNQIMEVVAFHPKLPAVNVDNGDDADGMILRGDGHIIRRNLIANYADPLDTHNYYLPEPRHNAHADCFDTRELNNAIIEGNYCWSNFHVSKGFIFNGSSVGRSDITIRNNIFEYRDTGISAYDYPPISNLYVHNNLLKSRLDDTIESYLKPGTIADIPGFGIIAEDIANYLIFNNITVDCDNNNNPGLTGNPIIITGGSGTSDYNFSWNSDGSAFVGATPGDHGSLTTDPGFESYVTGVHGKNDYRLQASSALIGQGTAGMTGTNGATIAVGDDINGLDRPQDITYEPGPYEYTAGERAPQFGVSEHVNNSILNLTPTSCTIPASPVSVQKAKWRGNKKGALVIQFDDSPPGNALCGLEALGSRGLKGTWYIVPGRDGFTGTTTHPVTGETIILAEKWAQAPALGQELANHTMHHTAVTGFESWRSEVREASEAIWRIRHGDPSKRSLMAFNNSSSVAWSWAPKEEVAILAEFDNIERLSYMGALYHTQANQSFSVPAGSNADAMYCGSSSLSLDSNGNCVTSSGDTYVAGVNRAIETGTIYTACFHGILSSSTDACQEYTNSGTTDSGVAGVAYDDLVEFLDKVAAVQDQLWVAGKIQLYKYTQEVQRSNIRMHQECSDRIYFDLTSPLSPLYDEPITLIVTVPNDWASCTATQGSENKACTIGADGTVLIDAVPNNGRILLVRGN